MAVGVGVDVGVGVGVGVGVAVGVGLDGDIEGIGLDVGLLLIVGGGLDFDDPQVDEFGPLAVPCWLPDGVGRPLCVSDLPPALFEPGCWDAPPTMLDCEPFPAVVADWGTLIAM